MARVRKLSQKFSDPISNPELNPFDFLPYPTVKNAPFNVLTMITTKTTTEL